MLFSEYADTRQSPAFFGPEVWLRGRAVAALRELGVEDGSVVYEAVAEQADDDGRQMVRLVAWAALPAGFASVLVETEHQPFGNRRVEATVTGWGSIRDLAFRLTGDALIDEGSEYHATLTIDGAEIVNERRGQPLRDLFLAASRLHGSGR